MLVALECTGIGEKSKIYMGYLPKDISYYISALMDNNKEFLTINPNYDLQSGKLILIINLCDNILRGE